MRIAGTLLVLTLVARTVCAQALPHEDAVRVQEFYRLADVVSESVWPGWSKTPGPLLLVTEQQEFLFRFPSPPAEFKKSADGTYARPRKFPTTLLATFPAFGPPAVIVVGEPQATEAKSSSRWLLTMMHEHFHQLQYAQAGYYDAVTALGLSHGDQSGMWILNYPFPYERADLNGAFETAKPALLSATSEQDGARWKQAAIDYKKARAAFFALLSPEQARYLEFQLWQEGIARYTEIS